MEFIPKTEVHWWLIGLRDLITSEQQSGGIDMAKIRDALNSIMQKVVDY